MKLSELLKSINPISVYPLGTERIEQSAKSNTKGNHANLPDWEISSIHYRAQEVQPAGMFIAIEGQTADGHDYIHQALKNGAVAIVAQKIPGQSVQSEDIAGTKDECPIIIHVPDTRMALADLATCFYNNPSEHMHLIGITGTNGKTTVAYLIESILLKAGFKVETYDIETGMITIIARKR